MSDVPWYRTFFDAFYLRQYGPVLTDELSERQVDHVIDRLGLEVGARVLDLCCGHGRHAIRLARRGMRVTGLDLSDVFLDRARADAEAAGVEVRWIHGDMREIPFTEAFDAVINLFTAFGYLEDDDEDLRACRAVAGALVPGGAFLVETIHRDNVVARYQPKLYERHDEAGVFVLHENHLDLVSGRLEDRVQVIERGETLPERRTSVRLYTVPELRRLFEAAGLTLGQACGGLEGDALTLESPRLVVIGRKPGTT